MLFICLLFSIQFRYIFFCVSVALGINNDIVLIGVVALWNSVTQIVFFFSVCVIFNVKWQYFTWPTTFVFIYILQKVVCIFVTGQDRLIVMVELMSTFGSLCNQTTYYSCVFYLFLSCSLLKPQARVTSVTLENCFDDYVHFWTMLKERRRSYLPLHSRKK